MTTPEKKVKNDIKKLLNSLPNCWYFMPASNGFGRAGIPDFVGHINGMFFAIEAKAKGGKPTALQIQEMISISTAKGAVWLIDEVTEELKTNLLFLSTLNHLDSTAVK
jgi:Holliday junction resolvase